VAPFWLVKKLYLCQILFSIFKIQRDAQLFLRTMKLRLLDLAGVEIIARPLPLSLPSGQPDQKRQTHTNCPRWDILSQSWGMEWTAQAHPTSGHIVQLI